MLYVYFGKELHEYLWPHFSEPVEPANNLHRVSAKYQKAWPSDLGMSVAKMARIPPRTEVRLMMVLVFGSSRSFGSAESI